MKRDYSEDIAVFRAFCDENRLMILDQLRGGEKCACVLLEKLEIGQPCLSYHMKILVDSGVVACRQDGKWMHYRIDPQGAARAAERMKCLTAPREQDAQRACT